MADIYSISEVMYNNHEDIISLLKELKENLNKPSSREHFQNFKWNLEKHLFVEEKAIFSFFNSKDSEDYSEIPYVIEEHNLFLRILEGLERDLEDGNEIDISKFESLLEQHKKFEESNLYPKLDRNLSDSQKKHIINRINQIIQV